VVEHIEATRNLQETDWLEWKSGYDLTIATGRASTGKHIIGFANRMPDQAQRHADGYAYLVLGVEPGSFHGMPVHDSADIENWLRPYVGDGILYDIDYVAAGDVETLFITVDPPRWGDDIHCLRKSSEDEDKKTMRSGTIYVRKSGKTEMANAEDIDRLTARARRQGTELDLSVEATGPLIAPPASGFSKEACENYVSGRSDVLLRALPNRPEPWHRYPVGETRTREQFEEEVRTWAMKMRENWPRFALVRAMERDPHELGFIVVNQTEENFESVQVEATLAFPAALVFNSVAQARKHLEQLEEPAAWGKKMSLLRSRIQAGDVVIGGVDIEPAADGERTNLVFPSLHVRPKSRHDTGGIILGLSPQEMGTELSVSWRLTSTGTPGDLSGTLTVAVKAPS